MSIPLTAQTYGGEAYSAKATVTVPLTPVVSTGVNDTGPVPDAGGNINLSSAAVNIPNVLNVGAGTSSVNGSGNTMQANASVASVDTTIGGFPAALLVTADTVASSAQCTCPNSVATGSATIQNLRIGGSLINVTGAVNQTITVSAGTVTLTVVINQRVLTPGSITVNALHLSFFDALTGTVTNVVVASSRADIVCPLVSLTDNYSGRGTGVRIRVDSVLVPSSTSTIVTDTGGLPTSGGSILTSTAGVNVLGLVSTGVVTSRTSGGAPGGSVDTSQSDSTVNNLSLSLIGAVAVNATLVRSNTLCQCGVTNDASCSGGSQVAGLAVSVGGIPITINVTGKPNQTVNLLGVGTLTINEQIPSQLAVNKAAMTVNALHFRLNVPLTASSDIVVAHSHSDIQCAIPTSAADVSVSGRVTDAFGRGVSNTRVVAVDPEGNTFSGMTNGFGYYRLDGILSGVSYVVSVSSKRHAYAPRVIELSDHLIGLDFEP